MANTNKEKFWRAQVRIPRPMIEWVKARADDNFRSLNAEIVELIRDGMDREKTQNRPSA